jgi:lipopolysaccharide export system permease protein
MRHAARLPAYLRRRVGTQILALLLMITALIQVLQMLEVTTEILKRGLGLRGLLYYALLQVPSDLMLALPLAVLLGAMLALGALARHSEIAVMRAAGLSLARIFGHLVPLGLAFALVQVVLAELAVPRAETALKAWWTATARVDGTETSRTLWARSSGGPLSIRATSADGRRLDGVRVYGRDSEGLLTWRLAAAHGRWTGHGWQLEGVTELRVGQGSGLRTSHRDTLAWEINLSPDDVVRLDVSRPHLSSLMLAEVILGHRPGTQPLSYYETVLYRSFAAPLGLFVMLLLALPVACSSSRGANRGRELLVALVLGLGFLLCDGIATSLGTGGRYPPLLIAFAAPFVFSLIGILELRAYERV